ncbi:hypothetical protein FB45DRAFT_1021422 [Roridomyces roridus]|uniref:F-box domain-containing protein n=1 Tax=Roridomyces roridus TaxID=1738132 RepID=A0AAD7FVA2_9AGAR|nr:hypothetical protein FB45DRAFT_1021422 [Roridomyces roridus]
MAVQSCPFTDLPCEIIGEVLSHAESLPDVVCLSLTCQLLWKLGRHVIYLRIVGKYDVLCWAGDRIICAGDYLWNKDIPEHIMTLAERQTFSDYEEDPDRDRSPPYDHVLFHYPWRDTHKDRIDYMIHELLDMKAMKQLVAGEDWEQYRLFTSFINMWYKIREVDECTVDLCNLSRRQYVRGSALDEWRVAMDGVVRESDKVGFQQVVLSRISVSSEGTSALDDEETSSIGAWAGDRFDFVYGDWLEGLKEAEEDAWVDASDGVLKDLEAIWHNKYGSF